MTGVDHQYHDLQPGAASRATPYSYAEAHTLESTEAGDVVRVDDTRPRHRGRDSHGQGTKTHEFIALRRERGGLAWTVLEAERQAALGET